MASTRAEAVGAVLDDLAAFTIRPNDYYDDLEAQAPIDTALSGKIGSLRAYCQQLGWSTT